MNADEAVLRYEAFLGDVVFRIDTRDASARWGWVPPLDFAMALAAAIDELLAGTTRSVLDFTESDAEIYFRREDDRMSFLQTSAMVRDGRHSKSCAMVSETSPRA